MDGVSILFYSICILDDIVANHIFRLIRQNTSTFRRSLRHRRWYHVDSLGGQTEPRLYRRVDFSYFHRFFYLRGFSALLEVEAVTVVGRYDIT
tara:strand:+ start:493 stop:771 length:279 start_codon:yes stop_codon:yes gene_type:complete